MILIEKITLGYENIEGDVFQKIVKNRDRSNLESFYPGFGSSKMFNKFNLQKWDLNYYSFVLSSYLTPVVCGVCLVHSIVRGTIGG